MHTWTPQKKKPQSTSPRATFSSLHPCFISSSPCFLPFSFSPTSLFFSSAFCFPPPHHLLFTLFPLPFPSFLSCPHLVSSPSSFVILPVPSAISPILLDIFPLITSTLSPCFRSSSFSPLRSSLPFFLHLFSPPYLISYLLLHLVSSLVSSSYFLPSILLTLLSPHLVPSFTIPGSGTSDPSMKSTPKHFPPAIGVLMIDGSIPKTVVAWTLEHCSFPHKAFLWRRTQTSPDQETSVKQCKISIKQNAII